MKTHRSYIPLADGSENKDDRDGDRYDADDAKDGTDAKDASQNEPKRRHGPREPKAAMPKRRHTDSLSKIRTHVHWRLAFYGTSALPLILNLNEGMMNSNQR